MRAADDTLARLVAPREVEDFWQAHHERRPLLGRGAGRVFEHLLSTAAIEALLAGGRLRQGECRLVSAGEKVPRSRVAAAWLARGAEADDAVVDPLRVAEAFAEGNTLVLDALHRHHAPIAALCRDLEGVFGHAVQANAYLTPAGGRGFDPHYDTHDVFVLQIEGRKRWRVYGDPVPAPAAPSGRRPDLTTTAPRHLEAELAPGDVLYLPRGWFHDAEAADDASLHLTVGLLATTWADALRVALDEAVERDPRLRAALSPGFPWWSPDEVDAAWSD
ncbi:MAG: cupin-like domain-containing protein, partial [Myxococcales bacterium]|nr:cupin-like domain-containing protein [Myxococcales bacterium]